MTVTLATYDPTNPTDVGEQIAALLNQLGGLTTANEIVADLDPNLMESLYAGLLYLLNATDASLNVTQPTTGPTYASPPASTSIPASAIVNAVPDGYLQVFTYTPVDPYPGYVEWEGPSGDLLFTVRPPTQPYAATPEEDAVNAAVAVLIVDLEAMVKAGDFPLQELLALLEAAQLVAQNTAAQNTLGAGSTAAGPSASSSSNILGTLMGLIQKIESLHLPGSVLNNSSMSTSINNYQKRMTEAKQIKGYAQTAVSVLRQAPNFSGGGIGGLVGLASGLFKVGP